jgi:signal transduction histidine kinase
MLLAAYAWIKGLRQNYATRIQLYLNFAFFTPLVILSLTTLSLIIQAYRLNLESEYLEKAESLSGNIAPAVFEYQEQKISKVALLNRIYEIAQYAGLDINLFNSSGWLIASSQPLIYDNELLSNYINPLGYIDVVEGMADHTVLNEKIGFLKFQNTYTAIKSFESGDLIGILSLPFYASKKDLDHQIINVLINIINIFTVIFLAFLFVSFFASSGLTFPLKLITEKIQKTTLSGYNEPLSWNSEDEIGLMVREYNRMLINLEDSKKALAKSEKESAWREMARQVAHEIKNPLTPMKLTLQHMRRKLDIEGEKPSPEKVRQIDTLLDQINTLSDIATSFSAFAKMPMPQIEEFDIRKLLLETIALYDKKEFGEIRKEIIDGEIIVSGDRQWIGRAISNIIINGFQASQNTEDPIISVRMKIAEDDLIRIEIEDNGEGVSEEIQDKIFLPNFSTKFTGSGLGLAIAKKGIEHADGKIWFESKKGSGTVFFIELVRVNVV